MEAIDTLVKKGYMDKKNEAEPMATEYQYIAWIALSTPDPNRNPKLQP
jgi:hypothetical protein